MPMPEPTAASAEVDTLLDEVLAAPDSEWRMALENACARHPTLAERLRRRFGYLQRTGLTESDARLDALAPGQHFGPYLLLDWIGSGAMGVVFRARRDGHEREVALKVVRPELLHLDGARERFLREGRAAARVEHPALCTVYDFGEHDGTPFLAMRYVRGETLASRLDQTSRSGRLSELVPAGPTAGDHRATLDALLALFEEVARGLHEAHAAGLVHRDVKPDNIVVDGDGRPVLIDFGLARSGDAGDARLTRTGEPLGTPAYMAPEQVRGEAADARTDVYALAASLYECLTLRPPFEAAGREVLYREILTAEPPDPQRLNPHLPRDLAVVLAKALEKDRARRYARADELADELARVRRREPVRARPASVLRRARARARRHPLRTAAGAALVLAFAGLAFMQRESSKRVDLQNAVLASRAAALLDRDALVGALVARHAWRATPDSVETRSRLLAALARNHQVGEHRLRGRVGAVARAPDGGAMVAPTSHGVWLLEANGVDRELRTPDDAGGNAAMWASDGSTFAVAGPIEGGLWRFLRDGTPLDRIDGYAGSWWQRLFAPFHLLDRFPDGTLVAGDRDGELLLLGPDGVIGSPWQAHTLDPSHRPPAKRGGVVYLRALAATGEILSMGADGLVSRWQPPSTEPRILYRLGRPIVAANATADGRQIAVGDASGAVHVLSGDGTRRTRVLHEFTDEAAVVALSPDGEHLFAASLDQRFAVWHLGAETALVLKQLHTDVVRAACWSPSGRLVAFGDHAGRLTVVDRRGRSHVHIAAHADALTVLEFTAEDRLVSGSWDGTVGEWQLQVPGLPVVRAHHHAVFGLAWLPDGERVVSCGRDARVSVSVVDNGRVVGAQADLGHKVWAVAVSPDDGLVASVSGGRSADLVALRLWRVSATGELTAVPSRFDALVGGGGARSVALGKGGHLAVGRGSGVVHLLRARDASPLTLTRPGSPSAHRGDVAGLAFSRDGRLLASASLDGTARLWSVEGQLLATLAEDVAMPWSVDFAPDGRAVLIGFDDGRVELRSLSGEVLCPYRGAKGRAKCARVSPDGRFVAAASNDGNLYVWTFDGEPWLVLPHGDLAMHTVAFSPDGRRIAAGLSDGSIHVWPITEDAIESLAKKIFRDLTPAERAEHLGR